VEGTEAGGGGAVEIGPEGVATVGGFGGGGVETVEGEVEKGAVRLAGAGIGGGEDVLETGADSKAVEDGREPIVEVGKDREGPET